MVGHGRQALIDNPRISKKNLFYVFDVFPGTFVDYQDAADAHVMGSLKSEMFHQESLALGKNVSWSTIDSKTRVLADKCCIALGGHQASFGLV